MDENLPPETWITAAPQDTVTTRDVIGGAVPPAPAAIPFRYHLYWSGSDQDGAVVGFYCAVVETVGKVGEAPIPPLPGPKPRDYHYTTARDSVIIFNVHEDTNDRQHAFFIYAVDNKGKSDPTPARVIFNTLDLYPPVPVIDAVCQTNDPDLIRAGSHATGLIFHPNQAWDGFSPLPVPRETTIAFCDTFKLHTEPSVVVPVGSRVHMRWHSEIRVANNPAVAYKYQTGEGNEVEFVQVPASVTGADYNTTDNNRMGPGLKVFTLRAIDRAGGARSSPPARRRFFMNLFPDTWFAGPDSVPAQAPNFYTVEKYRNGQVLWRYLEVGTGTLPQNWSRPIPGSLLSPDSVNVMPARRGSDPLGRGPSRPNKTFFEIYTENTDPPRHRIYVHSDGDTVHFNSWVLLHGGGFDADSPYSLRITINNPSLPGWKTTPVLTPGPANGSPVGMHFRVAVKLGDSTTIVSSFPQSQIYPFSDPAFVAEPHIGGYQGMQQAGRAYAIQRSEDGDKGLDNRIDDPVAFRDSIDKDQIPHNSPRYALRDKVITFYVDRAPYLALDDANFHPAASGKDTIFTRSLLLTLSKVADDDPYQKDQRSVGGVEAGVSVPIFRFSVAVRGRRTGTTEPAVYVPQELNRQTGTNLDWNIIIPDYISGAGPSGTDLFVDIEVCDCKDCEAVPGQGRCRRYSPIHVTMLAPDPQTAPSRANSSSTGPGSSGESSRSRTP